MPFGDAPESRDHSSRFSRLVTLDTTERASFAINFCEAFGESETGRELDLRPGDVITWKPWKGSGQFSYVVSNEGALTFGSDDNRLLVNGSPVGFRIDAATDLQNMSRSELIRSINLGIALTPTISRRLAALFPRLNVLTVSVEAVKQSDFHSLSALPNLSVLVVEGGFFGLMTFPVAAISTLTHLEALNVSGLRLQPSDSKVLEGLSGLKVLELSWTGMSADAVAHLATRLKKLEVLKAGYNKGVYSNLRFINSSPALKTLDLSASSFARGAFHSIAAPRLERLFVGDSSNITDSTVEDIAEWKNISELEITRSAVTPRGLGALAGLPNLEKLDIFGTKCNDECAVALARLIQLRNLGIGQTGISDAGLQAIGTLQNLEELDLGFNDNLTDNGYSVLPELPTLHHARIMNLSRGATGASILKSVSQCTAMRSLLLQDFKTTAEELKVLSVMPSLRMLTLSESAHIDIQTVRSELPDIEISYDPAP